MKVFSVFLIVLLFFGLIPDVFSQKIEKRAYILDRYMVNIGEVSVSVYVIPQKNEPVFELRIQRTRTDTTVELSNYKGEKVVVRFSKQGKILKSDGKLVAFSEWSTVTMSVRVFLRLPLLDLPDEKRPIATGLLHFIFGTMKNVLAVPP